MTAITETTDPRVERSKSAVLEAAGRLLMEGGVPSVTVEAIVERSGVARSTIYRHWDSRRELLLATFSHLMPVPAEPDVSEGPLRTRLIKLLEAYVARLKDAPWAAAIPTFLDATSRDPELAGVRERLQEQNRAPIRHLLEGAIEAGELPADTGIAEAVAQLAGPIIFRHLITREPVDRAFAERVVDLFLASRRA